MSIENCKLIQLPIFEDKRGSLSFVETGQHLDFDIKRNYFIYNVPGGQDRGMHAHKKLHQLLLCLSGSFEVILDDGKQSKVFCMNKPNIALYICPMIWRELKNFSSGAVCSVLASDIFDSNDYIYDYRQFVLLSKQL